MCGRFTIKTPATDIARAFQLSLLPSLTPRYNVAPTQPAPIVRRGADSSERELTMARWGLIPSWSKDGGAGVAPLINARAETCAIKPAFRVSFQKRRCLAVADGFYEWKKVGREKQPMYIHLRGGRPFGFAALWDRWKDSNDQDVDSFVIITVDANELLRPIHDRMPAILDPSAYEEWLDCSRPAPERLLRPYSSEAMTFVSVSDRVSRVANDDADCIAPLESHRQQSLF
jgi:putative SOS response-associated peptidase YedK